MRQLRKRIRNYILKYTQSTTLLEEVANTFLQMDWVSSHLLQLLETWFENARFRTSILVLNKCFNIATTNTGISTNNMC